uniref:PHD-type domain-containing protein n=1 Tax=Strigamia maritima TaxID=126957 RepID=T1JPC7_STRMM
MATILPSPTSYTPASASGQQYNGARLVHPYTNSQAYSGSQGTQYVPSEIYGQYGNRLQPNWDSSPVASHDAMHAPNAYNHGQSPRHHTISSPPPHPVLRSPPPSAGMGAVANYRQMMSNMNEQNPQHGWPQVQIASPSMMRSPRTTPSPGMGHAPTNLPNSSPLLNRSPAHKPFSPHGPPPPAHQHAMAGYENAVGQPSAPSPSPRVAANNNNNNNNNGSDPLQSLQKMVMSEAQPPPPPVRNSPTVANDALPPLPTRTAVANFGSIEQLAGKDQQTPQSVESTLSSVSSPSSSSCHEQKSTNRASPAEIDVMTEDGVEKCNGIQSPRSTPAHADDETGNKQKCSDRNGDAPSSLGPAPSSDQSPRGRWKMSVVNSASNQEEKRTLCEQTCNGPNADNSRRLVDTCVVSCPPKKKGMLCFRQQNHTNDSRHNSDKFVSDDKEYVECRSMTNNNNEAPPPPAFTVVANPALTNQHTIDLSHLKTRHLVAPPLPPLPPPPPLNPSSAFADHHFPIDRKRRRNQKVSHETLWSSPTGSSSFNSSEDSMSPRKKRGRPLGSKNKPKSPSDPTEKKAAAAKKTKNTAATAVAVAATAAAAAAAAAPSVESDSDKKMDNNKVATVEKAVVVVAEKAPEPNVPKVIRGPYLHVEGPKDNPLSVTVVNVHSRKHEESDASGGRRKKAAAAPKQASAPTVMSHFTKRKLAKIGFSCTLSAKYDAVTKDKTWVCELCRKGSHHKGLGDLFGPYFELVKKCSSEESSPVPVNVKALRSRDSESSVDGSKSLCSPETNRTPREMWVHENCIVWSHGVYLVGNKVYGLEEAVRIASDMICCKCKESGATLGCLNKGCAEQYHYACALEKGCHLDEENFSLVCFKHKRKPRQGLT